MPKLALINMVIGFTILFLGAALGTFVATDMSDIFASDPEQLHSWRTTLFKSAHGHTSLFAFSHVLFALTMPYSNFSPRVKVWQTIGFCAGTFAMCPLLLLKSLTSPSFAYDPLSLLLGLLLSAYLFAVLFHAFGIFLRIKQRS